MAKHALVVELADTLDLGSSAERRGGSTPSRRTIFDFLRFSLDFAKLKMVFSSHIEGLPQSVLGSSKAFLQQSTSHPHSSFSKVISAR